MKPHYSTIQVFLFCLFFVLFLSHIHILKIVFFFLWIVYDILLMTYFLYYHYIIKLLHFTKYYLIINNF